MKLHKLFKIDTLTTRTKIIQLFTPNFKCHICYKPSDEASVETEETAVVRRVELHDEAHPPQPDT